MCLGMGGRLRHRWLPASRVMPSGFETKHPCWGWGPCLRAWRGGGSYFRCWQDSPLLQHISCIRVMGRGGGGQAGHLCTPKCYSLHPRGGLDTPPPPSYWGLEKGGKAVEGGVFLFLMEGGRTKWEGGGRGTPL